MRRVKTSRSYRFDLLSRRPESGQAPGTRQGSFRADPTAQLDELADLVDRGLLSAEEMQFQRGKVVDA